jgi:hypothetical protein
MHFSKKYYIPQKFGKFIYDWYTPLLIVCKFTCSKPAIIRSVNATDTRDENTLAVTYNGNPNQCPNE